MAMGSRLILTPKVRVLLGRVVKVKAAPQPPKEKKPDARH